MDTALANRLARAAFMHHDDRWDCALKLSGPLMGYALARVLVDRKRWGGKEGCKRGERWCVGGPGSNTSGRIGCIHEGYWGCCVKLGAWL